MNEDHSHLKSHTDKNVSIDATVENDKDFGTDSDKTDNKDAIRVVDPPVTQETKFRTIIILIWLIYLHYIGITIYFAISDPNSLSTIYSDSSKLVLLLFGILSGYFYTRPKEEKKL